MNVRALAFVLVLVALGAIGAVVWLGTESSRETPRVEASLPREESRSTADDPSVEREESAPAAASGSGSLRETIDSPPAEEREDRAQGLPPTPDRPGPGQGLLQLEVVAAETSEPLAGVELWLWTEDDLERAKSSQTDPARGLEGDVVVTDEDGRSEFVVVAGRAYELVASAPRGRANDRNIDLRIEPLAEGEERFARIMLPTAWTFLWHVRAVDGETAQPIAGAQVEVLAWTYHQSLDTLPILTVGTTDGDGRARLRLPSWEFMAARIEASGYFWGGCSVSEEASSVETSAHVELNRSAALTAVVLDVSGMPAAGIDVRLHAQVSQLIKDTGGIAEVDWTATTGASGSCDFLELPSRVQLEVELRRGESVLWRPKAPQTEKMTLEPGEHRRVEWRFEPACVLSGTLRDQDGNALPQVPLVLIELSPWSASEALELEGTFRLCEGFHKNLTRLARTTTDDAGRFSIPDVPTGIFGLGPDKPDKADQGWGEWPEELGPIADLPAAVRTICIAPDERTKTVELVLDRGLRIRGQVLGPDGDPVRGTGVYAQGVAALSVLGAMDWLDREGRFELGPLVAGRYTLRTTPPDPFFAAPEPIDASAGEEGVILGFSWGGTLRGRVVDTQSGETLKASLFLAGPRDVRHSHTEGEGFRFESLPPGTYDLAARTGDGRVGVLSGLVLGAQETAQELVLSVAAGAKIDVRTQAQTGSLDRLGVEWDGILVWSWWGGEPRMKVTVPPGEIRISWWADEDGSERLVHEERRRLAASEEAVIEFVLPE